MNYTQHYQLCLWDEDDRILMSDFNADNAKTDAAMAGFGNCKIVTGTYIGNRKYGSDEANRNHLIFPGQPLLVFIGDTLQGGYLLMMYGTPEVAFVASTEYQEGKVKLFWDTANTVSWYGESELIQANAGNRTYRYMALIAME